MTDPSKNTMNWGEKFVTWQALGLILSILIIGIGWALVSAQQADARSQKRDDDLKIQIQAFVVSQQGTSDSVIRLVTQQEAMQKTLDRIASKLNVQ